MFKDLWQHEPLTDHEGNRIGGEKTGEKEFKIRYHVNLVTAMSEEYGQIMQAISESEELEIFQSHLVVDLIDYKW